MSYEKFTREQFSQFTQRFQAGYSSAEIHGFLTGLALANVPLNLAQPLIHQYLNDDHALGVAANAELSDIYPRLLNPYRLETLQDFWHQRNAFELLDQIANWAAQLITAFALQQPDFSTLPEEVQEVLNDINELTFIGYEDDQSEEEIASLCQEILDIIDDSLRLAQEILQGNAGNNADPNDVEALFRVLTPHYGSKSIH